MQRVLGFPGKYVWQVVICGAAKEGRCCLGAGHQRPLLWTGAEQKFSDLTNRVEMLETELVAMKLCKLKMEADKTQVEVHAKELEKALSALQAAANPDLAEVRAAQTCIHWQ